LEFYQNSPAYRERTAARLSQAQREYWSSIENRQLQAKRTRSFYRKHPEARLQRAQESTLQWADPALRQWRGQMTRQQWTEEFRQQRKEAYNKTYLDHSLRFLATVMREIGVTEKYDELRRSQRNTNLLKYETLCKRFFDSDEARLLEAAANHNHRVMSVRKLSDRRDVYDLEVSGTHNFALASGVFVHNSAKQGRDRRFQAILPIKGKILNVEKARLEKVLTNQEIRTIITALGCGIGGEMALDKLRYHKIIIMCDADVDGNHIRTLLLTFFYRQMAQLLEAGHIYIAQPPLFKVKRGKREEYVETEEQMARMLLDLGSEGRVLTHVKSKRTFKEKSFLELLTLLMELESLLKGVGRYRLSAETLLKAYTPKKGLPMHYIRMDGQEHLLFSDEDVAAFAKKHDLNLDELEKASATAKGQYAEIFEASEIAELVKKLEKLDLSLEDYLSENGKVSFKLTNESGAPLSFAGLREVLHAVEDEGRRGMTIQRYKGLGEMNPTQLWETTMDPAKRTILKVTQEDAVKAEELFTTLMGEEVEPRKQFIEEHALEVKELDI
jgi:DNA gyrase subunit B